MTVHHTAPRLKYFDHATSRNIIISFYFLIMHVYAYLAIHTEAIDSSLGYFYFASVLSFLAFLELLTSIHLYRLKRFVVNLQTMLGAPKSILWK
ncbi:unnamed protein product [Gongylonema pulchrum]|uniref:Two-component sensor histidine kinase n=1 Tax=Gongylonema pulchrum TaxID=637853 RepID=A0A183DLU9_9BILA|nr:unnamed protein product [Gongylonema pulchrum]